LVPLVAWTLMVAFWPTFIEAGAEIATVGGVTMIAHAVLARALTASATPRAFIPFSI
jgi:hypothetical protein